MCLLWGKKKMPIVHLTMHMKHGRFTRHSGNDTRRNLPEISCQSRFFIRRKKTDAGNGTADKILKRICGALSDQTAGKFPGDDKERGVKTDGPADRHLWENAIKYYVERAGCL